MSSNEQNPAVRKNKIIDRLGLKKLGLIKKSQMYEFKEFYKIGMSPKNRFFDDITHFLKKFSDIFTYNSNYRPSTLNF